MIIARCTVSLLAVALVMATPVAVQAQAGTPRPQPGAGADQDAGPAKDAGKDAKPAARAPSLPKLLDDLKTAKDTASAKTLMQRIERAWLRSGSDTADLLMTRVGAALQKRDAALAVELADRILALQPDWAEAWNKRATAFFILGDTARSVSDLAEALRREPRHYQALAGLGAIFSQNGDKKNALAAFRRALEINPHFEDIAKSAERLAPDVDGLNL